MIRQHLILLSMIFGLCIACTSSPSTSNENTDSSDTAKVITTTAKSRIDSTLQSFVQAGKIAGVSALIYEKGEEVYFNAFGMADREKEVPMQRNTIVQIFSMTKPVTGVALMQQFEKDRFQLDDPLADHAPEFSDMNVFAGLDENGEVQLEALERPITIRDITRHTAGFATDRNQPGLGELLAEADPGSRNNTLSEMAQKLGELPLAFQPGTQWRYGPSVDVQAYVVERLSGQPFDEYLQEHIFEPLGMDETGYVVPEEKRSRFAAVYHLSDEGVLSRVPDEEIHSFNTQKWPSTPGGYGLTATIDDYMTFARMLVNEGIMNGDTILQPETVKLMATNHLDEAITERQWLPSKGQVGFGIDFAVRLRPPASAEENNGVVGEFFWDGAASTLFWVDPKNELTAVLFVQLFPFDRIGLHKGFRDAVYGGE